MRRLSLSVIFIIHLLGINKKWPGFLNVESYKILAALERGVRTEELWLRDQGMQEENDPETEQMLEKVGDISEDQII